MKIGFDHEKYIKEQSQYILERVNNYDKLYLEFGGKLISDLHAKESSCPVSTKMPRSSCCKN